MTTPFCVIGNFVSITQKCFVENAPWKTRKMGYTMCTKRKKDLKIINKTYCGYEKVINTQKCQKKEKIELYTKLSTLSTKKEGKNEVYIVKKQNMRFVKSL